LLIWRRSSGAPVDRCELRWAAFDECPACRFGLKLERLRRRRPKQPHYFDRKLGGRMAPGWNLVVPPTPWGGRD